MQTFMPYPSLRDSVLALDQVRLNKQVTEAKQILDTLLERPTKNGEPRKGWLNHPAVLMWHGFEDALALYHNLAYDEWEARGGENPNRVKQPVSEEPVLPWWLGDPLLHASHRSQLLAKAKAAAEFGNYDYEEWYSQFLWTEKPGAIPYKWPVKAKLNELTLVPLPKQPTDWGCGVVSATIYPIWDVEHGLLNFGMIGLNCYRAWEKPLRVPLNVMDITRNEKGTWCYVVKD